MAENGTNHSYNIKGDLTDALDTFGLMPPEVYKKAFLGGIPKEEMSGPSLKPAATPPITNLPQVNLKSLLYSSGLNSQAAPQAGPPMAPSMLGRIPPASGSGEIPRSGLSRVGEV